MGVARRLLGPHDTLPYVLIRALCCVVLRVEFGSDEFVGSESSGHVEVVVIISGGSSITPIEAVVNPKRQSARGEGYINE